MIPLSATVEEPEQGTWVADLVHVDPYPGNFELGGVTWTGVSASSLLEGNRYKTRAIGGKGGVTKKVLDRYYYGGGTGNTLVSDVARDCGETSSPNLPNRAPTWQRSQGTAGQALTEITKTFLALWWIGRDGVLTAAAVRPTGDVDLSARTRIDADTDGEISLVGESCAGLLPGMVLDGQTIRHLRWVLTDKRLTAEVSFVSYAPTDLRGGLDYLRSHRAIVESQEPDGTLNLIVGNRFSLTKVPYQGGLPGQIVILPGDVVTVCSWGGDPRQWFAQGVQRGPGSPIARVGDQIDCGTIVLAQVPVTPPGAGGVVTFIAQVLPLPSDTYASRLTATLATVVPPLVPIVIPISGFVVTGSERVSSS